MNEIVVIYGSYAKEEDNEHSDVDVLVVTNSKQIPSRSVNIVKKYTIDEKVDWRLMSYKHFKKLISINSLYIHHIKECGIFLRGKEDFDKLTSNIGKYKVQDKEVRNLIKLADDCINSIEKNGVNVFDLSVLFTFFRNGIILLNYKFDILEFNKEKLLKRFEENYESPRFLSDVYYLCYDAKLAYNRNVRKSNILNRWNAEMARSTKFFLKMLQEEFIE